MDSCNLLSQYVEAVKKALHRYTNNQDYEETPMSAEEVLDMVFYDFKGVLEDHYSIMGSLDYKISQIHKS